MERKQNETHRWREFKVSFPVRHPCCCLEGVKEVRGGRREGGGMAGVQACCRCVCRHRWGGRSEVPCPVLSGKAGTGKVKGRVEGCGGRQAVHKVCCRQAWLSALSQKCARQNPSGREGGREAWHVWHGRGSYMLVPNVPALPQVFFFCMHAFGSPEKFILVPCCPEKYYASRGSSASCCFFCSCLSVCSFLLPCPPILPAPIILPMPHTHVCSPFCLACTWKRRFCPAGRRGEGCHLPGKGSPSGRKCVWEQSL